MAGTDDGDGKERVDRDDDGSQPAQQSAASAGFRRVSAACAVLLVVA
ncbi:hypothetical protein J5X84_25820 [Streptosporangiaceae bacterium NEAU-GS5]|nr:hypothetical protein [Streptosporangiaceae bacterium NEAU-GS5]